MKRLNIHLSTEDALILQLVNESGEEDVVSLTRALGMRRRQVMASLERLRRKGLVRVSRTADDWWVYMSSKGKQLSHYVWPDMPAAGMI